MGVLRSVSTGRLVALPDRSIVGRSELAHLKLTSTVVSSEHAAIYFDGTQWKARDLGSRNGTFVQGSQLPKGRSQALKRDTTISFGALDELVTWTLVSAEPPGPAAVSPNGDLLEGGTGSLWLPNLEHAEFHVASSQGCWLLSGRDGTIAITSETDVPVAGCVWRLYLPPVERLDGSRSDTTRETQPTDLSLHFDPSLDREHVRLVAQWGDKRASLGARAFSQALLALAYHRIEDEARGVPAAEVGWVYSDTLRDELNLQREALNLHIWRAIQHFGKAGLPAERLVERRRDTQQIRLGFSCSITSLRSAS